MSYISHVFGLFLIKIIIIIIIINFINILFPVLLPLKIVKLNYFFRIDLFLFLSFFLKNGDMQRDVFFLYKFYVIFL